MDIVLILIIPNLIGAGEQLAEKVPKYFENVQDYLKDSPIEISQINDRIQKIDFNDISNSLYSFLKGGFSNWLGSTFTIFSSLVGGLVSAGLGFF